MSVTIVAARTRRSRALRVICLPFLEFGAVAREYLRLDIAISIPVIVLGLLVASGLTRTADNPQMLEAFVDDEVWQALALDGTLHWPYGDPANFLDPRAHAYQEIPPYWGAVRYPGLFYYGGAMYTLATPIYAGLRLVGAPPFPTGVIVLRTITLGAALLSLIFLYNFARRLGSRAAGILAVLFFCADPYFLFYTINIHPDLLQVLCGLLALALAVRHTERGDTASLVALGLACGFVQGTKFGGAWTVPMAALALWWGLDAARLRAVDWATSLPRVAILAASALAGWIVTTPYLFDIYYAKATIGMLVTQGPSAAEGPFGRVTILTWLGRIYEHMNVLALVLCALAIGRVVLRAGVAGRFRQFALALVLCASQLLVYGSGKFWIELGYLLLAAGLMAVLAFDTLIVATQAGLRLAFAWIVGNGRELMAYRVAAPALAVAFLPFYAPYGLRAVSAVLDPQLYHSSTQLALNQWALDHIQSDQLIYFDAYAYFDPLRLRVIRSPHPNWPRIAEIHPDYLVLSSWVYNAPHYQKLLHEQALAPGDTYPFSVRVYQDLLNSDTLGPTRIPGIDYVADIKPTALVPSSSWTTAPQRERQSWAMPWVVQSEAFVRLVIAKAAAIWSPPPAPIVGAEFRVYRLTKEAAANALAGPERPAVMR
jgi:dolichyl-phosphate-mannose-protein mannosyltransferase